MKILGAIFFYLVTSSGYAYTTGGTGYAVPKGTTVRINEHGTCRKVQNTHATYNHFVGSKASTEWSSFVASPPASTTLTNCDATYRSCLDYLKANPGATSGKYTIDPDGVGVGYAAVDVYCDMTTDGGGWTLVWSNTRTGTNKPTTNMNWITAATTTPLCSQAQGAGTGCATYLNNNKETFNYYIGLDWWMRFTNNNKNSEMMYQWSSNFGAGIQQSAKFNFPRSNTSRLFVMEANNYVQMTGSVVPGVYTHIINSNPFSTIDADNDLAAGACPSYYTNTPFWYTNCWSGSLNGGGEGSGGSYYNGAYYINSVQAWGDASGSGAGNGWLFVREYSYLANCTEIKSKYPNSPSGTYWIDNDGVGGNNPIMVQCDMTSDGGGWTLLFNQKADTGGYFANSTEALTYNVANPNADRYSILSYTEGFRSIQRNFTFKINWPGYAQKNIWRQRSNPSYDQAVNGYVPISIGTATQFWGGLERNCTIGCGNSLIDGAVGNADWWYAVGSYAAYTNGLIPASLTVTSGANVGVNQTQLWVRDDSFLLNTPRDCQDVLEYGQSIGSGLYWVDPDQNGSSMQVYCDMASDGGGWTLVFNHNIVGGYFANAADAMSKNTATPTANLYSILDQLDNFKSNGRYIFKINWPGYIQRNIWIQTTNPTVDQAVAGYAPLVIDSTSNYWGGLERYTPMGYTSWLMDGSVNHGNWFYAIGTYIAWGTPAGIPASDTVAGTAGAPQVQLWTRRAEGQFTKRSCKEILQAGLSWGSGLYTIDPDGVGGQLPFRVHCDMVTSGGGWTRVAYNNGLATTTTVPIDFFVNKYNPSNIGFHVANNAASINAEWFSKIVGTTDAMLVAPSYPASPFIDVGLGIWQYDTARCSGTLLHTSRTAGCAGQSGNDNWDHADKFNISFNGGAEAIVPHWLSTGNELCHSGKGNTCTFDFYLR